MLPRSALLFCSLSVGLLATSASATPGTTPGTKEHVRGKVTRYGTVSCTPAPTTSCSATGSSAAAIVPAWSAGTTAASNADHTTFIEYKGTDACYAPKVRVRCFERRAVPVATGPRLGQPGARVGLRISRNSRLWTPCRRGAGRREPAVAGRGPGSGPLHRAGRCRPPAARARSAGGDEVRPGVASVGPPTRPPTAPTCSRRVRSHSRDLLTGLVDHVGGEARQRVGVVATAAASKSRPSDLESRGATAQSTFQSGDLHGP